MAQDTSTPTITGLLALLALIGGLALGVLPPLYGLALLGGAGLFLATLRQPLVGLTLALLLGPAKAFLSAALPGLPADWGQAALALALAAWLARAAARRQLRLTLSIPLLALLLFTAAGALSLTRADDLAAGLRELLKWLEMAVIALLVLAESRSGRGHWVVAAALLAGTVQAGVGLWQFGLRGHGPEHFLVLNRFYRAYGTFEQPNPFAGYMGLIWPVAAGTAGGLIAARLQQQRKREKSKEPGGLIRAPGIAAFLLSVAALLSLAALAVSFSRGAWLGAAAAMGTMLLFWPWKRGAGVALLVAATAGAWLLASSGWLPGAIAGRFKEVGDYVQVHDVRGVNITTENFALVERVAHWQAALAMVRDHPWLGVGLDNYAAAYPDYQLLNWKQPLGHAHNLYLNILAETGVIGLGTYVALWGTIFAVTIHTLERNTGGRRGLALGLLGAFAHLTTHHLVDNLYVNNTHLYIGVLLGLLLWLSRPALPDEKRKLTRSRLPPVCNQAREAALGRRGALREIRGSRTDLWLN